MRYMTKQCYETMQKCDLHFFLRASKKAESFSEAYFKALYRREEKKWLAEQREISEVKFEDIYPLFEDMRHVDGSPLEEAEQEALQKLLLEEREKMRLHFENRAPYDPEREKKSFRRFWRENMKRLKKKLPEDILQRVADLRVLALNAASAEVKREIRKYCMKNLKIVRAASKAYEAQYKKEFAANAPDFAEALCLHDREIRSCRKRGKDVLIEIKHDGVPAEIDKLLLKNCKIIKQDGALRGARCLYHELYKTDEGYELHFLMEKRELMDYIVAVEAVVIWPEQSPA